ncbi:MAG: ribosome maturation factor RimM [Aromatoleum sp.]|nr:ribosome maturation factor RimM [Aromatoleum sp.]
MPPAVKAPDDLVVMGHVVAPYGVRGWVKVRPFTEAQDTLLGFATWWVRPVRGTAWQPLLRLGARVHSDTLVAQLGGVDNREAALALKGWDIAVPRAEMPAPGGDEIYWADLVGLDVVNREGVALGRVSGVTEHGAHPLLKVARPIGEAGAERLIPYVPVHVDGVDLPARRIDVDWGAEF